MPTWSMYCWHPSGGVVKGQAVHGDAGRVGELERRVAEARLRQVGLGLGQVVLGVGTGRQGAEEGRRDDPGRLDGAGTGQLEHPGVVDPVAQGHLEVVVSRDRRDLGVVVGEQEHHVGRRALVDLDVAHPCRLARVEVEGDLVSAPLDVEPLYGRGGRVAQDDGRVGRLRAPVVGVGHQHDLGGGAERLEDVRARAGRVVVQPVLGRCPWSMRWRRRCRRGRPPPLIPGCP